MAQSNTISIAWQWVVIRYWTLLMDKNWLMHVKTIKYWPYFIQEDYIAWEMLRSMHEWIQKEDADEHKRLQWMKSNENHEMQHRIHPFLRLQQKQCLIPPKHHRGTHQNVINHFWCSPIWQPSCHHLPFPCLLLLMFNIE